MRRLFSEYPLGSLWKDIMASSTSILALVVLYKMDFAASPSYNLLALALKQQPGLAQIIRMVVVDNSPQPQLLPAGFAGSYLHDGTNPGLAKRYNLALSLAAESNASWLLLLDQDTSLTLAYLEELLALSSQLLNDPAIVAIVPKLVAGTTLYAPHVPVYREVPYRLDLDSNGVVGDLIHPYNSGALVRVQALQAIGGFPEAYWLDYLDFATFHRLQAEGGRIYVMKTRLQHEMSAHRPERYNDPAHAPRHRNHLSAARRYYDEFGSNDERRKRRREIFRMAVGMVRRGHLAEAARLLQAAISAGPHNAK